MNSDLFQKPFQYGVEMISGMTRQVGLSALSACHTFISPCWASCPWRGFLTMGREGPAAPGGPSCWNQCCPQGTHLLPLTTEAPEVTVLLTEVPGLSTYVQGGWIWPWICEKHSMRLNKTHGTKLQQVLNVLCPSFLQSGICHLLPEADLQGFPAKPFQQLLNLSEMAKPHQCDLAIKTEGLFMILFGWSSFQVGLNIQRWRITSCTWDIATGTRTAVK